MKSILFATLFLCSGFYYFSNDEEMIEIAPDFFVEKSLENTEKAKKVYEVFRRLKSAKGDNRSRRPMLHLVKSTGKGIAVAYHLSGVIKLEDKGYDLCQSFGDNADNALALLLGHEMVHIYEKHEWENQFAWEYGEEAMKKMVSDERRKDEIQADYMGGVLAYQAGYQVFGITAKFLEKVYDSYNLTDSTMTNYPGMLQRQKIAVESADKLRYYTEIYEAANLLTIKEVYDNALIYYDEILRDFNSREIYNNIGVVSLQSALQHFNTKQNPFAFPVELDLKSRMNSGKGIIKLSLRTRRLLDAIHYFERARHLDPSYPTAYLNKSCANALLGIDQPETRELEWKDAEVSAERVINLCKGKEDAQQTLANSYVALGILAALKKDSTTAIDYFNQSLTLNSNNLFAQTNKFLLTPSADDEDFPLAQQSELIESKEVIDNMPFKDMSFNEMSLKHKEAVSNQDSIFLYRMDLKNSYVLTHQMPKPGNKTAYHFFHLTEPGYTGSTAKGINLQNGTQTSIIEKYGPPHNTYALANGAFLQYNYKNLELIFQTGPNGKLIRWILYKIIEQ